MADYKSLLCYTTLLVCKKQIVSTLSTKRALAVVMMCPLYLFISIHLNDLFLWQLLDGRI